jgi:hypothetical protein
MTKQTIIAITIGILILIAAGGAFLYSQNKPENTTTVAQSETTPTPNNAMAGSISQLLTSGETSKCTFGVTGENGNTNGTVYTSGENARADISTKVNNKETAMHMIRAENTFYIWGDSIPMGIKMEMSVEDMASRMQDNESFSTFDPNKEVNFKCATWTEDVKLFTPPTTIKFTSFGNMAPTASTTKNSPAPTSSANSSDKSNECNICNSLTGAAKSACVQQFNCQ